VLLTGVFVALLGEVSELLCSGFGVVVFPARYCPSFSFLVAVAGVAAPVVADVLPFVVEPLDVQKAAGSGSGLSGRYFPVYSGRSSSVVYS